MSHDYDSDDICIHETNEFKSNGKKEQKIYWNSICGETSIKEACKTYYFLLKSHENTYTEINTCGMESMSPLKKKKRAGIKGVF